MCYGVVRTVAVSSRTKFHKISDVRYRAMHHELVALPYLVVGRYSSLDVAKT